MIKQTFNHLENTLVWNVFSFIVCHVFINVVIDVTHTRKPKLIFYLPGLSKTGDIVHMAYKNVLIVVPPYWHRKLMLLFQLSKPSTKDNFVIHILHGKLWFWSLYYLNWPWSYGTCSWVSFTDKTDHHDITEILLNHSFNQLVASKIKYQSYYSTERDIPWLITPRDIIFNPLDISSRT